MPAADIPSQWPGALPPLLAVLSLAIAGHARAGDWPQILGPDRNGQARNESLLEVWPEGGPPTVWSREVARGFAGVAVERGRLVLFHRAGNQLLVEGLEAATGKPLWSFRLPTRYVSTISEDDGPRCVPLIHKDRVFLLGPGGELLCLAMDGGRQIWSRNIREDFQAPEGYFGCGGCPLVEGDKLLVNAGGPRGAGIVALSLADGSTIWQATDEGASYSSPVAATVDGVRHVVFVTRLNVVSIDPDDGTIRFRFPFGARGPTVNAANPLILGDHVFVSASYGVGAQLARIAARSATTVWESDEVMSSQYSTCVAVSDSLVGVDGRQDVGVARLRAFDPQSGKVHWTEEGFGTATLIAADGKILIMKTDGTLVLAGPSAKAFQPLAKARLLPTTVQALPALSEGLFFVRDTKTLKCVRVGKPVTLPEP